MIIEQVEADDPRHKFGQLVLDILRSGELGKRVDALFTDRTASPKIAVDMDFIREKSPELCEECLQRPLEMGKLFEQTLQDIENDRLSPENEMRMEQNWRISFEGNLGKHTVTPRGLKSRLVNKLVKIQGIVVSTSKVRHRLLKSSHYCDLTKSFLTFAYNDTLSLRFNLDKNADIRHQVPLYDNHENPITMEYGHSEYRDVQVLTIQEMPENIPTGLLSRSIEVVLQEDLVDAAKPGDRVQIVGIFRPEVTPQTAAGGVFRSTVVATSVVVLTAVGEGQLTAQEIREIKKVAGRPDLLKLLVRSVAPSIAEASEIKEAILMLLLGGSEKQLSNGIKLRGDINLLLVGDPSTGKSQLLRRVMSLASLAFSTTGRGSTGVGLTAAVTIDKDTGEKQLEAGAMVLADRGVICVDEFDKMSVEDRVAMHEVMEQQTVTIAKAGIHVSLNARCAVIAAANPRYGEYNPNRSAAVNISMPDSLLSRFDLVFIVQDKHDSEVDRTISQRVTQNHRFEGNNMINSSRNDSSGVVEAVPLEDAGANLKPYEQFNALLHEGRGVDYLNQNFLKKYLNYAKRLEPKLTDATTQLISRKWSYLRELDAEMGRNSGNRIIGVTIRSLESLIRLSTAYAKVRLASEVALEDVFRAFTIFNTAFYGSTEKLSPNFWRDVKLPPELKAEIPRLLLPKPKIPVKTEAKRAPDSHEKRRGEAGGVPKFTRVHPKVEEEAKSEGAPLAKRAYQLQVLLVGYLAKQRNHEGAVKSVFWEYVASRPPSECPVPFGSEAEYEEAIAALEQESKVVVSEGKIFLV